MPSINNILAAYSKIKHFILTKDFYLSIVVAVIVISCGVFLGWYNNKIVLTNPSVIAHYNQEQTNPLSFLSNWDGPDYLNIEQNSYTSATQANFFPLYPLIARIINMVISSPLNSALAVSWLSFVGVIYFYLKIVKFLFKITDNMEAIKGLLFFILFPTAVFFLATYTESLFAFLSLGAIYSALRKKYLVAALLLMLVTATHVTGIFVLALLAMILLEQKAKIKTFAGTIIVGSLGLLGYILFLKVNFNKPLAFITSQVSNHGWLQHGFSNLLTTVDFLNLIFIILLIITAIYWWNRKRSFSIYSLLFILIPLVGKQFGGFNRYVLMAFPLELMLYGYLRDKKLGYTFALIVTSVVWTYFLFQYAGGYIGG
ncbi:MAG: mannosyltransferase family protein [Candidatus Saccharimonadales bacterium]